MADPTSTAVAGRRRFMAAAGAAGIGLTATQLLVRTASRAVAADNDNFEASRAGASNVKFAQVREDFPGIPGRSTNEVVLNFALTLEILESDLYRQALNAASGLALRKSLSRRTDYSLSVGPGGLSTDFRRAGFAYLHDFAFVEAAHRDFLTSAITASGFTPTTANPKGYAFPGGPGSDLKDILSNILPLEETGVRAYLGALPYLTDLNLGVTAGGIYSTECRHSAAIRYVLGEDIGPSEMQGDLSVSPNLQARYDNLFEYGLAPATVISAAGAYFVK